MSKASCIIIHPSYVIRKGIRHIVDELMNISIYEFSNYDPIEISKIDSSSHFFIIEADLFIADQSKILAENKKNHVLVIGSHKELQGYTTFGINEAKLKIGEKVERFLKPSEKKSNETKSDLSDREKSIVREVVLGHTNKEIAEKLFISPHTVITHRKNITNKLGIKTISGLTVYAILNNIIDLKESNIN